MTALYEGAASTANMDDESSNADDKRTAAMVRLKECVRYALHLPDGQSVADMRRFESTRYVNGKQVSGPALIRVQLEGEGISPANEVRFAAVDEGTELPRIAQEDAAVLFTED